MREVIVGSARIEKQLVGLECEEYMLYKKRLACGCTPEITVLWGGMLHYKLTACTQRFSNALLSTSLDRSHLTFIPMTSYEIQEFGPKEKPQWTQNSKIKKMPTLIMKASKTKNIIITTNLSFACMSLA